MKFSVTTEYALRIMAFMSLDETKLYTADEIFDHLNIPYRYLRKLMGVLSKSSLIESVQGKHGGYMIAKNLSDISLLDIIRVIGDDKLDSQCFFGFNDCAFHKKCSMHDKWNDVREKVKEVLVATTLEEVKASGPHSFIKTNISIFTKNN